MMGTIDIICSKKEKLHKQVFRRHQTDTIGTEQCDSSHKTKCK